MKIALDVRYRTRSGASRYIQNIVPLLLEKSQHEYLLVRYRDQRVTDHGDHESITFDGRSRIVEAAWDQLVLPKRLARHEVDVYHSLKLLGPARTPCPKVTVAHSITTPFRGEFPASSPLHAGYWNVLGNLLYRTSDHVIAVSEFVKDFVVEELGMTADDVTVIPHGIDARFRPDRRGVESLPAQVRPPFLLIVGNMFPVKNHLTAVRAFAGAIPGLADHQLVFAGADEGRYAESVRDEIDRLDVSERVRLLGFRPLDDLIPLYSHADLVLLPSLTEGFGLTLLEAMACGAPVLASRRGSIPQVGGASVRMVDDPMDDEAWAEAILELTADSETRRRMSVAGRRRATDFTWERSSRKTLALYERLSGS